MKFRGARARLSPLHCQVEETRDLGGPRPQREFRPVLGLRSSQFLQGMNYKIQEPVPWGQYSFVGGKGLLNPSSKSLLTRKLFSAEKPRDDYRSALVGLFFCFGVVVVVGKGEMLLGSVRI